MTLSLKDQEYVLAARYMGVTTPRIILRHILPNLASLLIIDATINVSIAIIAESALSYFGFGVQPPDSSLGTVIADGAGAATTYPWLFVPAAVLLVLIVLSVNLVGDGLRDALDPTTIS
jgi:peptide/nickel transport system permease protein